MASRGTRLPAAVLGLVALVYSGILGAIIFTPHGVAMPVDQPGLSAPSPGAAAGRSIFLRLVLPSVLTMLLFAMALFVVLLPALEHAFMERKRETIRQLSRVAWDTLAYFHQQEQSGRLSRSQAQDRAIEQLRAMRYGDDGKDYFWINDLGPRMIMHPYRPDLEGRDISDFADPSGKRLFMEVVQVVRRSGEGYVDYMWQWKDDPRHIVPKVSFVREFVPWGWVVGTGIYVQDVAQQISAITSRLTYTGLAILAIVAIIEMYMVQQSLRSEGQRRKAEQELERSRWMLRLVMDNIPQLIFWKDRKGRYVGGNRAAAAHLGLASPEDLPGLEASGAGPAALEGPFAQGGRLEKRVLRSGRPHLHAIELCPLPQGGESLWMDVNRIPLKDLEGQVVGILCTCEDITARKEMDQALSESERRFRTLVENAQVGISIAQKGAIVYLNPEQERITGSLPLPYRLDQAPPLAPANHLASLIADPAAWQGLAQELDLGLAPPAAPDQPPRTRWVHCRTRPMVYQGEEALLIIMLDITKARELEHMLRIQDKMASLGRVAAGIAHEIRNPLSGINMYLSALRNQDAPPLDPAREAILDKIQSASGKIEGVIKRVLDFARPGKPKLSWFNLNQVVEEVIELSSVTLRKGGIKLETDLAPNLPLVYADSELLGQVLMNLVTNAVQALAGVEGEKKIGLASALNEDRIIVRVADSGPGVPPDLRSRIFNPFFTDKKSGSGIGLSLCHRIVSDHGGRLEVDQSAWGGAEFTMDLPASIYWGYDSHG